MKNLILNIKELKEYSEEDLPYEFSNNPKIQNQLFKHNYITYENGYYKFKYVGIILIGNLIIKCYPKYIQTKNENEIERLFSQVLKVIMKYDSTHEDPYETNELDDEYFNKLSLSLFFIEDYYENGSYRKIQNILETNGNGEINWNKTINDNNVIIENNRPYYTDLQTVHKINEVNNYFRLLHECIITECSQFLEKYDLLNLFDLTAVELSENNLEDFGEYDFLLRKLEKELNIEFNTHKRKLIKYMHTYISEKKSFTEEDTLTVYGTSTFNNIWEEVCCKVLNDQLRNELGQISLPIQLSNDYKSETKLIKLIKKPKWHLNSEDVATDQQEEIDIEKNTLIPDLVTTTSDEFIILDAKYYNLKLENNKLSGQPGIESITKQYFYELAFKHFIDLHNFKHTRNAFLFPTDEDKLINMGYVELDFIKKLQKIQVIKLPAKKMYEYYLKNMTLIIKEWRL